MNDFQKMIVSFLVGPFITGRPIDCQDLARLLQKSFPQLTFDELTAAVSDIADGIGVRILDSSDQNRTHADSVRSESGTG